MISSLRGELRQLLAAVPTSRTPAVRRCDSPDALLATNLPFLADEAAIAQFTAAAQQNGWTVTLQNGWLLLDHPVPAPEMPPPAHFGGESGCLLSLLMRHPQDHAPCESDIRALAKAADESPAQAERLCAAMHRTWAERLRRHEALPGGLAPYLLYVHQLLHSKEDKP